MRRIVMFNRVSMDGFFAGPNGEIDWFVHDPELDKATHEMMKPDTILLGRLTYKMFEGHWPNVAKDPNAPKEMKAIASELNEMTKVVFSKTLKDVTWENSRLVKGDVAQEVRDIKKGNGADIVIFGSGSIVQQLANERLIDEFLIAVSPVVLGVGKPLFENVKKFMLKTAETRRFDTGNVLIHSCID